MNKSSSSKASVQGVVNQASNMILGHDKTPFILKGVITTLGVVDLQANPAEVKEIIIEMCDPINGIGKMALEIKKLVEELQIPEEQIMGYGFAFPGLLDVNTKIIKHSPNLGEAWRNVPVKDILINHFGPMLFVEHNSNAAAIAEYVIQRKSRVKDLVYVNLGEGFSAGVIIKGELLYGYGGHAGEMGHMVIAENGPLCNCGNKGCLESMYAVPAIVRKANMELNICGDSDPLKQIWKEKGEVDIKDILLCSSAVETYAGQLIKQAGWHIGIGIANIINFYNPKMVCLGGILTKAGPVLFEPLIKSVNRHAFPDLVQNTSIELSSLGQQAGFYGACLGAIENVFSIDRIEILEHSSKFIGSSV